MANDSRKAVELPRSAGALPLGRAKLLLSRTVVGPFDPAARQEPRPPEGDRLAGGRALTRGEPS